MPSGWREPCPRVNFARRSPGPGRAGPSPPERALGRRGRAGRGGARTRTPPLPRGPQAPPPPISRSSTRGPHPTRPHLPAPPPGPRGVYARSPDDDIRPRGPARECPGRGRARRGRGRPAGAGSQIPDPPRSARGADHRTVWRGKGRGPDSSRPDRPSRPAGSSGGVARWLALSPSARSGRPGGPTDLCEFSGAP